MGKKQELKLISKKYILTEDEILHLICRGIIKQRTKIDANSYVPLDLAIEVLNMEE